MKPAELGATKGSAPIRNAQERHAARTTNVPTITALAVSVVMVLVQAVVLPAIVLIPVKLRGFAVRLQPVRILKMLVKMAALQAAVTRGNAMGQGHVPNTQMEPFAKLEPVSTAIGMGTHFAPAEAARRRHSKIVGFTPVLVQVASRPVPAMVSAQPGRGVSTASVRIKSIRVILATVRSIVRLAFAPTMCAATLPATVHASLVSMRIRIFQMVHVGLF